MLAQNNQCYTRIPNCTEQAGNTCNSYGSMLLENNTCYARINNCSVQSANTCTTCAPGYKISASACAEKYPGGVYIPGLNKVVWYTTTRYVWNDAFGVCTNHSGMYLSSISELEILSANQNYKDILGLSAGDFWSSTTYEQYNGEAAYHIWLQYGASSRLKSTSFDDTFPPCMVMCYGNP